MPRQKTHETITAGFHNVYGMAITAGTPVVINVSPNSTLSARMASLADDFDEYVCTKLRYRLRNFQNAAGGVVASAFYPGITDTAPLYASIIENLHAAVIPQYQTVPTEWHNIPKRTLQGMHTFYKTVAGTPESAEEIQGTIYADATVTQSCLIELEGEFVFRAPAAAAATPADRAMAAKNRERKRIMALLAEGPSTGRPPSK